MGLVEPLRPVRKRADGTPHLRYGGGYTHRCNPPAYLSSKASAARSGGELAWTVTGWRMVGALRTGVRAARRGEADDPPARAAGPRAPTPLPGAAYPDWAAIYTDNVGRIYRLMFSKVGNRPDAEDLTSQVFLAAFGPLRATAEMAKVRAYLSATARTVLAEHWRRTLGHQVTEIDPMTDLEDYSATRPAPADGQADERAARILRALPERQRQILVLRFLRGYSVRQAAAELGVSVANAKVLQHRALRAAAGLEQREGEGEAS